VEGIVPLGHQQDINRTSTGHQPPPEPPVLSLVVSVGFPAIDGLHNPKQTKMPKTIKNIKNGSIILYNISSLYWFEIQLGGGNYIYYKTT